MKIWLSLLCLFFLPCLALAGGDSPLCAEDPKSAVFREYDSISDDEIARRCTYDLEKHDPDADEKKINSNAKRTSNCEKGLAKMREVSERYVAKKKEVCLAARTAATCTNSTSQTTCMVDAANLADKVRKGQEELGSILIEGRKKLSAVSQYNRLLNSKFRRQQKDLWRMSKTDKERLFSSVGRINDPPSGTKLTSRQGSSPASRPDSKPAPESKISSAGQRPEGVPRGTEPRATEISTANNTNSSGPRSELRPQDYGARSWAEYERKLPLLLQQNERTTEQLRKFEEVREVKQTEHRAAASEMAVKAAQFFATAENLGYAGEDLAKWKKENPVGAKAEKLPAVAEDSSDNAPALEMAEEAEPKALPEIPTKETHKKHEQTAEPKAIPGNPAAPDSASEEPALTSFDSKLRDQSQNPVSVAERGRLKDLLRRRMQALKNGESPRGMEIVPGALVGDILAETKAEQGREPSSDDAQKRELGTVDVESALQDMEAQLRELDIQSGILGISSASLFDRVKTPLKKFGAALH